MSDPISWPAWIRSQSCTDKNCDGKGTVCLGAHEHEDGEIEYDLHQCQFCTERDRCANELERLQSELDQADARERKAMAVVNALPEALKYECPLDYEPFSSAFAQYPFAPEWIKTRYRSQDNSEGWPHCSRCGTYLGAGYKEGEVCLECDDSEGRAGELTPPTGEELRKKRQQVREQYDPKRQSRYCRHWVYKGICSICHPVTDQNND